MWQYMSIATRIFLILLSASSLFITPTKADYFIRLGEGAVGVSISADFAQGVPNIGSVATYTFGPIPVFNLALEGGNASLIGVPLADAIRARNPAATPTELAFTARSNGTWMHYDLEFNVEGISRTTGEVAIVDLSWRSFAIPNDVVVNGISINRLLPVYLTRGIEALIPAEGPFPSRTLWYLNDRIRSPTRIIPETQTLTLFNFTSLARPLDEWTTKPYISGFATQWEASTGFNLTFIESVVEEPEAPVNFANTAIYELKALIEAPAFATSLGNEVRFEGKGGSLTIQLMTVFVLISSSVYVGTLLVERRIQNAKAARRGRKNKR